MLEPELKRFLENPEEIWGRDHRQARKLNRSRERLVRSLGSRSAFFQWIEESLLERKLRSFPTLLIFNAGSSGSHWLQAMVGAAFGFPESGEVYIPKCFQERAANDFRIVDMVQIVQARISRRSMLNKPIVNTTHSTTMLNLLLKGKGVTSVFLCRDPVEIVLSRTYRKPEFRKSKAPYATDFEYLDMNVRFVKRIFETAMDSKFQLFVKYEELRRDPARALERIAELTGVSVEGGVVSSVAERYRAENVIRHKKSGNLFVGEHVSPPDEVIEMLREKMGALSQELGYS